MVGNIAADRARSERGSGMPQSWRLLYACAAAPSRPPLFFRTFISAKSYRQTSIFFPMKVPWKEVPCFMCFSDGRRVTHSWPATTSRKHDWHPSSSTDLKLNDSLWLQGTVLPPPLGVVLAWKNSVQMKCDYSLRFLPCSPFQSTLSGEVLLPLDNRVIYILTTYFRGDTIIHTMLSSSDFSSAFDEAASSTTGSSVENKTRSWVREQWRDLQSIRNLRSTRDGVWRTNRQTVLSESLSPVGRVILGLFFFCLQVRVYPKLHQLTVSILGSPVFRVYCTVQ